MCIRDSVWDVPEAERHRPGDKWLGARLRIPHELRYRLDPAKLVRRHRVKSRKDGQQPGFVGMGNPADEIWMHVAPDGEELAKHGVESAEKRKKKGREGQEGAPDEQHEKSGHADQTDPMQGGA